MDFSGTVEKPRVGDHVGFYSAGHYWISGIVTKVKEVKTDNIFGFLFTVKEDSGAEYEWFREVKKS